MSSTRIVNLFYDVTSPYSWLAFEVLCRYRQPWAMDLKLRPAFQGGIMNLSGNQPPALLPARGLYMAHDLERLSAFMDVPVKSSTSTMDYVLSTGTLRAQRFLTAASIDCPQHVESLSRKLWLRLWSEGEEIGSDEAFKAVALQAGLSSSMAESLCERLSSAEVKTRLKETTQEIVDHGSFGLPCYTTLLPGFQKPQMFFGSDRLELLAHMMGVQWRGPRPGNQ